MRHFSKLVRPYIIWSLLIIMVPLILIILYSVTTGGNELVNIKFTLENFKKIGEPIYLDVLKKSFKLGFASVLICLVVGYILAYFITRFSDTYAGSSDPFCNYSDVDQYTSQNLCVDQPSFG